MPRPGPDPEKVAEAERLAALGKSRREIGEALGVSEATVKRWLKRPAGHRLRSAEPRHHSPGWRQRERDRNPPGLA